MLLMLGACSAHIGHLNLAWPALPPCTHKQNVCSLHPHRVTCFCWLAYPIRLRAMSGLRSCRKRSCCMAHSSRCALSSVMHTSVDWVMLQLHTLRSATPELPPPLFTVAANSLPATSLSECVKRNSTQLEMMQVQNQHACVGALTSAPDHHATGVAGATLCGGVQTDLMGCKHMLSCARSSLQCFRPCLGLCGTHRGARLSTPWLCASAPWPCRALLCRLTKFNAIYTIEQSTVLGIYIEGGTGCGFEGEQSLERRA